MNLTIIFGNGFDKNLGLNTTYPDFYSWLDENQKKKVMKFIVISKKSLRIGVI
ncbi:MAG: bacteriophage abortive infection AbiH family protein [Lactococcus lactis]|nr:bacteriophage abortive infection AbiH family protein [Lactococcus lactis]